MIKDQSCCSPSQWMTVVFFSPQSLMSQVMLGDHPTWQVLPRFTAIVFLPIAFHLFLCSPMPASKVENILPAKLAKKSEATPEGLSWHRAGIDFVFSAGTELQPRSLPRDPTGFRGHSSQRSPQELLQESPLTSLLLQSRCSQHGPWLVSTNWPLVMILICDCGANKNLPTFLANLPAVFVQISAGH